MDRAAFISLVRDRLGFNQSLDEAVILRHLDMAQAKYENGEEILVRPWFLTDATYEDQTQAGIRGVELPEGFISFLDNMPLMIKVEDVWTRLYRRPIDKLAGYENETGTPTHYDVQGTEVLFYPLPDAAYDLKIPHVARLTALSTVTESVWLDEFPVLLLEEVLVSIFKSTRDADGLKIAEQSLMVAKDAYMRRTAEREHLMQDYIFGGDDA